MTYAIGLCAWCFQFCFPLTKTRGLHLTMQILFSPQCEAYLFLFASAMGFFQTYPVGIIPCSSLSSLISKLYATLVQKRICCHPAYLCLSFQTVSCVSFSAPPGSATHFEKLGSVSISCGQWPWEISSSLLTIPTYLLWFNITDVFQLY